MVSLGIHGQWFWIINYRKTFSWIQMVHFHKHVSVFSYWGSGHWCFIRRVASHTHHHHHPPKLNKITFFRWLKQDLLQLQWHMWSSLRGWRNLTSVPELSSPHSFIHFLPFPQLTWVYHFPANCTALLLTEVAHFCLFILVLDGCWKVSPELNCHMWIVLLFCTQVFSWI